jgi:hypothetical protein
LILLARLRGSTWDGLSLIDPIYQETISSEAHFHLALQRYRQTWESRAVTSHAPIDNPTGPLHRILTRIHESGLNRKIGHVLQAALEVDVDDENPSYGQAELLRRARSIVGLRQQVGNEIAMLDDVNGELLPRSFDGTGKALRLFGA